MLSAAGHDAVAGSLISRYVTEYSSFSRFAKVQGSREPVAHAFPPPPRARTRPKSAKGGQAGPLLPPGRLSMGCATVILKRALRRSRVLKFKGSGFQVHIRSRSGLRKPTPGPHREPGTRKP